MVPQPPMRQASAPTAEELLTTFDATQALTVGIEEEVMVLDPDTLDLAPAADEVLDLVEGDARFKRELPAAQLEIVTPPLSSVAELPALLAAGRRDLAAAAGGRWRFGAAGVHPFATAEGHLSSADAYAD